MTDKEAPVVVKGAAALAVGLFNGIQVTSGVLPPVSPLVSPTQRSVSESHLVLDREACTDEAGELARQEAPLGPQDQFETAVEQGGDWLEQRLDERADIQLVDEHIDSQPGGFFDDLSDTEFDDLSDSGLDDSSDGENLSESGEDFESGEIGPMLG